MGFEIETKFGRMVLGYGPFIQNEVQYPANVLDLWSDEELAAIGVFRTTEPPKKRTFRPIDIVRAMKRWGVAEKVLGSLSDVDRAEFLAAEVIDEDEPHLVAVLASLDKTADDI